MSNRNTPLLNQLLSVTGKRDIQPAQAMLDWASLQKFLGDNIPTMGIDAVAAGANNNFGAGDSTDAIQHILDTGGIVFLRPGTYTLSRPLLVTGQCYIWCEGVADLQMAAGSNCPAIFITDATRVSIRGIRLRANTGNTIGILISNSAPGIDENIRITDCSFIGWVAGVDLTNVDECLIANSKFAFNIADINTIGCSNVQFDSLISVGSTNGVTGPFIYQSRNYIGLDDASFAMPTPGAQAYNSVVQTIASATPTVLTFDTNLYNKRAVHNLGTPTRFVASVAGLYRALGGITWSTSVAASYQSLSVYVNGAGTLPLNTVADYQGALPTSQQVSAILNLFVGDYVEFVAQQNTGIARNTNNGATFGALEFIGRP